jgi:hypothetical protein
MTPLIRTLLPIVRKSKIVTLPMDINGSMPAPNAQVDSFSISTPPTILFNMTNVSRKTVTNTKTALLGSRTHSAMYVKKAILLMKTLFVNLFPHLTALPISPIMTTKKGPLGPAMTNMTSLSLWCTISMGKVVRNVKPIPGWLSKWATMINISVPQELTLPLTVLFLDPVSLIIVFDIRGKTTLLTVSNAERSSSLMGLLVLSQDSL